MRARGFGGCFARHKDGILASFTRKIGSVLRGQPLGLFRGKFNLATNAIEVCNLRRVYRATIGVLRRKIKEVVAVDDISFEVQPGELFGLLGPNGAGKTTTVKMLTTLLIPTSGAARVLGYDVVQQADALRARIGFIFGGERGLYWRLSAFDNLRYFATLDKLLNKGMRRTLARCPGGVECQ